MKTKQIYLKYIFFNTSGSNIYWMFYTCKYLMTSKDVIVVLIYFTIDTIV